MRDLAGDAGVAGGGEGHSSAVLDDDDEEELVLNGLRRSVHCLRREKIGLSLIGERERTGGGTISISCFISSFIISTTDAAAVVVVAGDVGDDLVEEFDGGSFSPLIVNAGTTRGMVVCC